MHVLRVAAWLPCALGGADRSHRDGRMQMLLLQPARVGRRRDALLVEALPLAKELDAGG